MKNITEEQLTIGVVIIFVIIGVVYFFIKNKDKKNIDIESFHPIVVDLLLMVDITNYLKEHYSSVISEYPNIHPVAIRLKTSPSNNIVFDIEKYKNKNIILITFYNQDDENIIEKFIRVYVTNELDKTVIDAFGDKDMLILK